MDKIGVSILGQEHKSQLVNKLIKSGFRMVHYDIMDGIFVKSVSLEEKEMNFILENTNDHLVNIHLMVADPEKYLRIYDAKADYITFHYESASIDEIKKIIKNHSHKKNLGIAINPKTNIEQIYEFLPDISHILVMSVVPGKGGQDFIESSIIKIEKLRKHINERKLKCLIQVDGGINNVWGPRVMNAGADSIVSGSYLLNHLNNKNLKNNLLKNKK